MQPYKHERTVLICGKDPEVSHGLETAIESLGYAVLSARDGDEVLSFLQNAEVEISALLLGVMMPNRGGLELLREIRAMDAKLPVIIVARLGVNAGRCRRAEEWRYGFSL
jgi:DNA-binding response OmpR family regulator